MFTHTSARRAALVLSVAAITASAAGAATLHRFAVSQTTGSGGAQTILQSSASGGALQGEVASSANASIKVPFGVLGEYNPSGSTFGTGVIGISTTGYALAGESLSNANPSILAYPGGTGIGLEATTTANSSNPAIYAESKGSAASIVGAQTGNGSGGTAAVLGEDLSTYSNLYGVEGTSINGEGVQGLGTGNADGVDGIAQGNGLGMYAESRTDTALVSVADSAASPPPDYPLSEAGVDGESGGGVGILGISNTNYGMYAESRNTNANYSNAGVYALSLGVEGVGVQTAGELEGYATVSDPQVGQYPGYGAGLIGNTVGVAAASFTSGGYPLELYGTGATSEVAYVDTSGNLYVHGQVQTFSDVRGGGEMNTYTAHTSSPTLEDVGSGHLSNGAASIALDPAMTRALDQSHAYHVFLTPEGDTKGLFVAQKTPQGFVVRETQGGRGNFDFDYRVVGAVDGHANDRMGLVAKRPSYSERMAAIRASLRAAPRRSTVATRTTYRSARAKHAAFVPYRAPAMVDPRTGLRPVR